MYTTWRRPLRPIVAWRKADESDTDRPPFPSPERYSFILAMSAVGMTVAGALIMFSYIWTAERKLFYGPSTLPVELEPVDLDNFDDD